MVLTEAVLRRSPKPHPFNLLLFPAVAPGTLPGTAQIQLRAAWQPRVLLTQKASPCSESLRIPAIFLLKMQKHLRVARSRKVKVKVSKRG